MSDTQDESVVVINDLTKQYGEFTALDHVSISVKRGGILGFIGPNGAGKTTTIRILVGLLRPTSGWARIAGADCVTNARKIKRLVGYMPDTFGTYDNMRVREYLDFFGAAFGIGRRRRTQRIDEVMETTGSTYMQDLYVEALSHGMKQRVGIARTLLHDPEVLILDEPANGLDPQARIEMRNLLLQLAAMGKTLIVTSHILPELSRICDQVAILIGGRLKACGGLDEILRQVNPLRLIEVQLYSPEHVERAAELIRQAMGKEADVTPAPAEAMVRFRTGKSEQELGELLSRLVATEIPVSQFRELPSDLEDAFLTVTRDKEAASVTGEFAAAGSSKPKESPS